VEARAASDASKAAAVAAAVAAEAAADAEKAATRFVPKKSQKLSLAIERCEYDYGVFKSVADHRRHCVCQSFDDGRLMLGCEGCATCWHHPACVGVKGTDDEVRVRCGDAAQYPRFKCAMECNTW
jgi:hypothetical protein